jgi:cell division septation protein DedD
VSPAINTTAALAPGFYINVGLFANDDNASKAQAKLKEADLPVFTQIVKGPKGRFTRVRVGPFDSQANADAASTKIQALGLDAVVFTP